MGHQERCASLSPLLRVALSGWERLSLATCYWADAAEPRDVDKAEIRGEGDQSVLLLAAQPLMTQHYSYRQ